MTQLTVTNSNLPTSSQGTAPTFQYQQTAPVSTKRQQDYIHEDIFRLLNPDCNRAFSSFEDAVDRLLPFHMLGAEETERADFEEAETLSTGGLLLSRHEAWQELCLQKSMQYADELNSLGKKLQEIVEQRRLPGHPRPEEEIYLSKLSAEADKAVSDGIRAEAQRKAAEQLEAIRQRNLEAERVLKEANERMKAEQAQASGVAGPVQEPGAEQSLPAQASGQQQPQPEAAGATGSAAPAAPAPELGTAAAPGLAPMPQVKQEPPMAPEPEPEPGGWSGWQ
ncbi:hypothetical protein COCSUDRAFT_65305 [Coccomyxa subellipsoidea C-169]|uniref:GLTSCR protein conserved domain-containing protein n=1 Tax=Coccomyxa subellipsoidea (strain C-169) TaxID=574566 RepID=I0Z4J2_COCSC|nr:hypothetical protein COCSUDRAFT_65305 [Coccomyxa subellipsoidea C-169]EIE25561.1 hypothetical protein COCSUDRAFT_65305 [Coccomyxa subellipsoidea C-169]|eukprot:XP_005650105.1 hypothetical protein COCSUDRAFT_65305 [Coccomyxa subellipsoidea C-169]